MWKSIACLLLAGCAQLPVVIPTGNPVTDVIVTVAVEEGTRYVASRLAPALLDTRPVFSPDERHALYPGEVYNPRQGLIFVE